MSLNCAWSCQGLLRLHYGEILERKMRIAWMVTGEVFRCRGGRSDGFECGRRGLEKTRVIQVAFCRHDRVCAGGRKALLDVAVEQEVPVGDDRY